MRLVLIGLAFCLASLVVQTKSATTARAGQATEKPSNEEPSNENPSTENPLNEKASTEKPSMSQAEKAKKKEEFNKKLKQIVAEVTANSKPLTNEDMKRGKDLLNNGTVGGKLTVSQLKKEEKEAKKEEEETEELDLKGGDEITDEDDDENDENQGKQGRQGNRSKRNALRDKQSLWPNPGNIPYVLSNQYTNQQRAVIAAAIEQFNMYTCIRFVPRRSESHYITISKQHGCYATIGMVRDVNRQHISLADNCLANPSVTEHELMHTLGFYHEHNRPDRDQYVIIHAENVVKDEEHNFEQQTQGNVQSTKYEYDSVMHYGKTFFSKDEKKPLLTIEPKDPAYLDRIGHAKGFSQTDVDEINALYCGGKKDVKVKRLCYDDYNNCHELLGDCKWDQKTLSHCMKSCNQCSDPPGELPCADAYTDCAESVEQCMWSKDILEKCPKTCNQCSKPPGPVPCGDYYNNCATSGERCMWSQDYFEKCPKTCKNTEKCPSEKGEVPCGDKWNNCSEFEADCSDTTSPDPERARKNCPKTCNSCKGTFGNV